jgi:hypothetical protein
MQLPVLCSRVGSYRRSEGTAVSIFCVPEVRRNTCFGNVRNHLPDYRVTRSSEMSEMLEMSEITYEATGLHVLQNVRNHLPDYKVT